MNDLMEDRDTISSVEIAKISDMRHDNVMRDIRKMFVGLEVDALKFEGVYSGANGQDRPCFHIDEFHTRVLSAGWNVKERGQLVDYFMRRPPPVEKANLLPEFQVIVDMATQLSNQKMELLKTQKDVSQLKGEVARVRKIAGDAENFMSIKAYINLNDTFLPPRSTGPLGKVCAKYCRENNIPITTVPDATYGKLNVYPVLVIKEAVDKFKAKLKEKKEN